MIEEARPDARWLATRRHVPSGASRGRRNGMLALPSEVAFETLAEELGKRGLMIAFEEEMRDGSVEPGHCSLKYA